MTHLGTFEGRCARENRLINERYDAARADHTRRTATILIWCLLSLAIGAMIGAVA